MEKKIKHKVWVIIAIILGIIGLLSPVLPKILLNEHQYDKLSSIGQWIGGTSALFIALGGMVLLVVNYLMQQEELKQAQIALEISQKQSKLIEKEYKIQNETLRKQKFENTLFNLLNYRLDIINSIELDIGTIKDGLDLDINDIKSGVIKGRRTLKVLIKDLGFEFNDESESLNYLKAIFDNFARKHLYLINHYYRNIKFILEYINNENMNGSEKLHYSRFLKNSLSNEELILLFYMGISEYGEYQGYKKLFEEFKLFSGIYLNAVFIPEHKSFYEHLINEE